MRKDWLFYAIWGAVGIGCLALAIATANASWNGKVPLNTQIDQANFSVNGNCSGTLISLKHRWVLTAHHCTASQYKTVPTEFIGPDGEVTVKNIRKTVPGFVRQVTFSDGIQTREVTYRTEIVRSDKERDLALLRIISPIPNLSAARIACAPPSRGEEVYIVGNPQGLYASVVRGMVSSDQRAYEALPIEDNGDPTSRLMQISGGIVGGNSGGAVYNTAGELVGVPVLGHRTLETLGFAVPLPEIHEFFKKRNLQAIAHCLEGQT